MATLSRSDTDGVTVLRIAGGLTHDGVAPLASAFDAATQGPSRVLVDLSNVPAITTPGLSLLLSAASRIDRAGGRLVLIGAQKMVADLLRRCRLDAVFTIAVDEDHAMRVLRDDAKT